MQLTAIDSNLHVHIVNLLCESVNPLRESGLVDHHVVVDPSILHGPAIIDCPTNLVNVSDLCIVTVAYSLLTYS